MRKSSFVTLGFLLLASVPFACDDDDTNVTPVVADAGGDVAEKKVVCGQPGALCAGNEWCAYDLVGSCGREGQSGVCKVRPKADDCGLTCPAVCGCDGKVYCNACEAQANGTDVDKNRTCLPTGGETLAYAIFSDPAKIAIFKKDTSRKICLRVTLVARLGTDFGLDVPSDWGVDSAEITNDPEDCTITTTGTPKTPSGTALRPNGGQGRVTFSDGKSQSGKYPCELSVAARLSFEPTSEYPWVPNVEPLAGEKITVSGACN